MPAHRSGREGEQPGHARAGDALSLAPQLFSDLRAGYPLSTLRADLTAGLTVAVLAVPLSMAIAMGAGVGPDIGLVSAIVGGLCVSLLGGSRFQVGGPAAALMVMMAGIIASHGVAGLLTATFIAGLLLLMAAYLRIGQLARFVPWPVLLGFTSGIGIVIAISQLKDLLGMTGAVPAEAIEKLVALWSLRDTINAWAIATSAATFVLLVSLQRFAPRWPGLLIAIVTVSAVVHFGSLPVETVGSRFGELSAFLPWPELPDLSMERVVAVLPSAFTIALLVGVESLLSATAADLLSGARHRPNTEILAQGAANVVSPLFGGLPVAGVIARTATNIASGARTPIAGVSHAAFVLLIMAAGAGIAAHMAIPCLAAVLVAVAWRLVDAQELARFVRRAPPGDVLVMVTTFVLTIVVDLTIAIVVGLIIATVVVLLQTTRIGKTVVAFGEAAPKTEPAPDMSPPAMLAIPVISFDGPLFFGCIGMVQDAFDDIAHRSGVIALDIRGVPLVDATFLAALENLLHRSSRARALIVVVGAQEQPARALARSGLVAADAVVICASLEEIGASVARRQQRA